jgi:hypothetical protein
MGGVLDRLKDLRAAQEALLTEAIDTLTPAEILVVLQEFEAQDRMRPTFAHALLARLVNEVSPRELGAKSISEAIAQVLRISAKEARRRLSEAADLAARCTVTGERLAPKLAATAAAQARGEIGAEHVTIIREFLTKLPGHIDATTRDQAEGTLARVAPSLSPEQLRKAAEQLTLMLDQDGDEPSDADRARKRYVTLGPQQSDGMSQLRGLLDPEARALVEAAFAAWAAPGKCNPDDETPCVDQEPTGEAALCDTRTVGQRNHDAIKAVLRAMLASGQLGHHSGLPVTVVVSTSLAELQSGAGLAVTGGGSLLPMADLIRMASHALHYLAVFDSHTNVPLYLGRSRRCASPGQRITLHSRDRGCTHPGCTAPGYVSQAHHVECDWADGGLTNIDNLTFACGPHNRLVEKGGWTTRKRSDGRTEWIPPPLLDTGQARVNDHFHPQNYLAPRDEDDDPG